MLIPLFLITVRFLFGFEKNSDSVRNEFCLVQKTRFGSDIIIIYYSCNSKYYSDSGWHDFNVTDVTHNNNDNK